MSSQMYLRRPARKAGGRTNELSRLATFFRALADPTRLRILALLGRGDVCVCHIYESLGIPQSKASRHLAYLKRAGLVRARKIGLWVFYQRTDRLDAGVHPLVAALGDQLARLDLVRADCCRLADSIEKLRPRRPPRATIERAR